MVAANPTKSSGVVAAARACVPATCGEILQGVDSIGPVLVSLPIDLCGTVQVALTVDALLVVEPDLRHARAALELALDRVGWHGGARVQLGGEIPQARGMGSSTADVAGVLGAVHHAAGVPLSAAELVALMTQVEPSDSSPLSGLWAIDHVHGRRARRLASVPAAWWLVAADSGVPVRTSDVHRNAGAGPELRGSVVRTTRWEDPGEVARVATESAHRSQERLPHPAFAAVRSVAARVPGGLGICAAHSGSVCAVICQGVEAAAQARDALAAEGLRVSVFRADAPGMRVRSVAPAAAGRTRPS
jgi:uncharacterized protein involved in propanediol utilization